MNRRMKKPLAWVGNTKKSLCAFPASVKRLMGNALLDAQYGGKHPDAKPLTGQTTFKGSQVLEVVDDHDGDTYRTMYTVRFEKAVYALHAFKKKSKRGIATPKQEIEQIKQRLKLAEQRYIDWMSGKRIEP